MNILYDGLIYTQQAAGGINRYFANLIGGLPAEVTPLVTASGRQPFQAPTHPNLQWHLHHPPCWTQRVRPLRRYLQGRYFRQLYRHLPADLLHPTYYSLLSREDLDRRRWPLVLTVHDMIHERFAAQLDPQGEMAAMKRRAIAAADAIICVSDCTKADLLDICAPPEAKITVIPLASDFAPVEPGAEIPTSRDPYFLFVGSRAAHKNFDLLLAALAQVAGRHPDVSLRVVGPPFKRRELVRLDELGLASQVVSCGHVGDDALRDLYRGSLALVYPSRYEGFGIPPLEAMSCGTVVVASNCSSIPEVVGDAGILFDPRSADTLTDILRDLWEHPAQRRVWLEKGYHRSRQFHWRETVRRTLAVYRSVAGSRAAEAA